MLYLFNLLLLDAFKFVQLNRSIQMISMHLSSFCQLFLTVDEMIKEFPQLTKIRTKSFTYEYAGGLFGSVNKPDKHAEEATRFALKVISSAKKKW